MPNGWTRVGTPDDLRELLYKPEQFKDEVQKRVAGAGAGLHEVYFEPDGDYAYVLTVIPGFAEDADRIVDRLREAFDSNVELLFTAEEMSDDTKKD
jgi:hypothetical protein